MKRINLSLVLVLVALLATAGIAGAAARNYRAHLSGREEVPPPGVVVTTTAQGQAVFSLSKDASAIHYKLGVANIENVFMAHIHKGAPGTNGPIVVWLYPGTAPVPGPQGQGRVDGVLVQGVFTAADLVNQGTTGITSLEELMAAIEAGNAYVNVHTNDGIAPPNTGPGDYPGGEIRGHIH
jgi:hypothetical protein